MLKIQNSPNLWWETSNFGSIFHSLLDCLKMHIWQTQWQIANIAVDLLEQLPTSSKPESMKSKFQVQKFWSCPLVNSDCRRALACPWQRLRFCRQFFQRCEGKYHSTLQFQLCRDPNRIATRILSVVHPHLQSIGMDSIQDCSDSWLMDTLKQ